MDRKQIRKSIPRFAGWLGLILCSLIIKLLPASLVYSFANNIASLGYIIARKQKKIALESLGIAFGSDKTGQERRKIARDCFVFMAKSAVELLFFLEKPQFLRGRISFEGKKYLDAALSEGRGVILVSAHFGNFPLMLGKLSLDGLRVGAIMRPMRDKRAEKFFTEKRRQFNINTIYSQPRTACVENTIKALRNNEIVFIPIDQNFGTAGVFVNFFGKKAATATGPIVLALRTKAVILPCFMVRQPNDKHKIIFEPPIDLGEDRQRKGVIVDTIQRLTNIIELYIRKYPAQWGWIHRRWKSKPNLTEGGA
jgi:KDO2-lipid IV(A) lauroyltransferase